MVKKLQDVCLRVIERHLDEIPYARDRLPPVLKEKVLEGIISHDRLTPQYFYHVHKNLLVENLRKVTLYKSDQVTDDVLKSIGNSCRHTTSITVHGCQFVTDAGIKSLLQKQKQLVVLELRKLPKFTGKGLNSIRIPSLRVLNVRGCSALTTDGYVGFIEKNPTISSINVADCAGLHPSAFGSIAKALRHNLEELEGCPHPMDDENMNILSRNCPNLKSLKLHGSSRLSGDFLIQLSQGCTSLTDLDLSYCYLLQKRPNSEALWTLPTTIRHLSLCGIMVEEEDLLVECIQRLKKIQSIRLCGMPAVNDKTFPQLMEYLGPTLEVLDISAVRTLTEEGLSAVAKYCKRLKELDFSMCREITCKSIIPLLRDSERALKIVKIQASCRRIMDADVLQTIALCCPNLEYIDVAGLPTVTDDLLQSFAQNCPKLTHVGLKGCVNVTDAGVCEIARCCPLGCLVLSGIHTITDKSIFMLANHCHHLDELYINGCSKVSPTTVTYLRDNCIPRVYIQHKTPNIVSDHLMGKNLDTGEFCNMGDMMAEIQRVNERNRTEIVTG